MYTQQWLAVTNAQVLRFFFEHLRDVSEDSVAPERELLYNASVLAHYATTSTASGEEFPRTPVSLAAVFDVFVLDQSQHTDPEIMEAAGSQCLLLTGFFGAQLRGRHNLQWYASLGASFYDRAARYGHDPGRAAVMRVMAGRFGYWRTQHSRLARELHELPKLVTGRPDRNDGPALEEGN
jgi:hypothetical protein